MPRDVNVGALNTSGDEKDKPHLQQPHTKTGKTRRCDTDPSVLAPFYLCMDHADPKHQDWQMHGERDVYIAKEPERMRQEYQNRGHKTRDAIPDDQPEWVSTEHFQPHTRQIAICLSLDRYTLACHNTVTHPKG